MNLGKIKTGVRVDFTQQFPISPENIRLNFNSDVVGFQPNEARKKPALLFDEFGTSLGVIRVPRLLKKRLMRLTRKRTE